ncbi:MAG TPA: hypothetical protein VJ997_01740, partial [Longimicrobiales bacterium]|nr:hypothetical protein [Longimicrobiales bacterium]
MPQAAPLLLFDYVDPLCYLLELELAGVLAEPGAPEVTRLPAEVRPPPGLLLDPDGPWWSARWQAAEAVADAMGR